MNKKDKDFSKAIDILIDKLKTDEQYYYSWQANIAMFIHDECMRYKKKNNKKVLSNKDLHTCCNIGAKEFLNLFAGIKK